MNTIYNTAVQLYEEGKYDDSLRAFEQLPQTNDILYAIATCHKDKKTFDSLMTSKKLFEQLMKKHIPNIGLKKNIKDNYISSITLISKIYIDQAAYDKAIQITKEASEMFPNDATLIYNTGHMYKCIGDYDTAIHFLLEAIKKDNTHIDTYVELINIYRDRGDSKNLLKYIKDGINHVKNNASLYNDLGLFYTQQNHVAALNAFNKAIEMCKDNNILLAKIHTNIGHLLSIEGKIKEGLEYYKKAADIYPIDMIPRQNYLMDLLYIDSIDYNSIIRKHLETGCIIHKTYNVKNLPHIDNHNSKIHIGYVSGDFFGSHPMTYFIKRLLNDFSENKFKVYCYSINNIGDIATYSKNIKWRQIKYLPLVGCIKQILSDKIDILIDLSGHTSGNRMDIFANRLAKLQLSYLGYPCITGMPEIDYYIIDKTFNFDKCKTVSLPNCFTHYEIPFTPQTLIQPYYMNGYITFCSFNKASKINDSVVQLWDSVLDAFPGSILIIKHISNFKFRNANRVKIIDLTKQYTDYIYQYNSVDISLDTFPYAGTTTTCESLLMGTPVITLADRTTNTIHQNTTASLLINSGLQELVSTNRSEYLSIIGKTIDEIQNCKNYKEKIQKKFLSGNVTNATQYINDYETLLYSLLQKK